MVFNSVFCYVNTGSNSDMSDDAEIFLRPIQNEELCRELQDDINKLFKQSKMKNGI